MPPPNVLKLVHVTGATRNHTAEAHAQPLNTMADIDKFRMKNDELKNGEKSI